MTTNTQTAIAPLPDALLARLIEKPKPIRPNTMIHTNGSATLTTMNISNATRSLIERGAPEGARNASVFSAACDLAGNGVTQSDAENILMPATNLPTAETKRTIESAYSKPRTPSRDGQVAQVVAVDGGNTAPGDGARKAAHSEIDAQIEKLSALTEGDHDDEVRVLFGLLATQDSFAVARYKKIVSDKLSIGARDFDRMLNEARKTLARQKETDDERFDYVEKHGCTYYLKPTYTGDALVKLADFTARIVEQNTTDDGSGAETQFKIEVTNRHGKKLQPSTVSTVQFPTMRWVMENYGADVMIEPGQSTQDRFRAAITALSQRDGISRTQMYRHTGWRIINDKPVYLTQAGALGDGSVNVTLDKELSRYSLPMQPQNVVEAMRASLKFLNAAPLRVTQPLLAAMYYAPLCEFLSPEFLLWLFGMTGTFKSSLLAAAMSHFGAWDKRDFMQFTSTANAIEVRTFRAKDVPFVVDDFAPQPSAQDMAKAQAVADRVIRNTANGGGRARLKADTSERATYNARGLVVCTAELLPPVVSNLNRLFVIEVRKVGDESEINKAELTRVQRECAVYPHAMAGYIQWVAGQWDKLKDKLPERMITYRDAATMKNQHARIPEAAAKLFVAWELCLDFAVEIGAITPDEYKLMRESGWHTLLETGENQSELSKTEQTTDRFLSVLRELYAQERININPVSEPRSEKRRGELVGWQDDEFIYLLPDAAFGAVSKFMRDSGRYFGVSDHALWKGLSEEGKLIKGEKNRFAVKKKIGDDKKMVIKLHRAALWDTSADESEGTN